MKTTILLCIILVLTACAAKKSIVLSQNDADRANTTFPGASLASLNEGKMHYEQNCNKCHGLKKPASRTEAEWREIVPRMAKKAKVDANTENLILQYVVTMGPLNAPK